MLKEVLREGGGKVNGKHFYGMQGTLTVGTCVRFGTVMQTQVVTLHVDWGSLLRTFLIRWPTDGAFCACSRWASRRYRLAISRSIALFLRGRTELPVMGMWRWVEARESPNVRKPGMSDRSLMGALRASLLAPAWTRRKVAATAVPMRDSPPCWRAGANDRSYRCARATCRSQST
eukprot:6198824-Pleurochrysis_carterae.AAC.1